MLSILAWTSSTTHQLKILFSSHTGMCGLTIYVSVLVTGVSLSLFLYGRDYDNMFGIVGISLYLLIFGIISFLVIVSMCAGSL